MMTLYRKYRPDSWEAVIGQDHIKAVLGAEIALGNIAHAYIFSGPRGVGKTTVARIFAKAINCEFLKQRQDKILTDHQVNACGECGSCQVIARGETLDIVEIDAASHRGIDTVREDIVANARFAPSKLTYKVFILDEAHMLTTEAWNALLKTLEEAPAHVVFILATTEIHKVPATVLSRCQKFNFTKLPQDLLVSRLQTLAAAEKIEVDPGVINEIARRGGGSVRDCESILAQVLALAREGRVGVETAALALPYTPHQDVFNFVAALLDGDTKTAFTALAQLENLGSLAAPVADDALRMLRDSLHLAVLNSDHYDPQIMALAKFGVERISQVAKTLIVNRPHLGLVEPEYLPLQVVAAQLGLVDLSKRPPAQEVTLSGSSPKIILEPATNISTTSASPISFEVIQANWANFIKTVADQFPSLAVVLGAGQLERLTGQMIEISFAYSFHTDKINQEKIKNTLSAILKNILNVDIFISAILIPKINLPEVPAANNSIKVTPVLEPVTSSVEKLAAMFGGSTV